MNPTTTPAATPQEQPLAARPAREVRVVEDSGALAYLFDTARFEHMFRIASAMAAAALIPEHLRGIRKQGQFTPFEPEEVKANCFLVVNQSLRWGMDPFAVAPETYVVGGKLAYQGKLVAAVINARAGLQGRLAYSFSGTKGADDFTITVSGTFPGDEKPREITLRVGDAKTENQMWKKDPEQKLVYSGAVKWARRYCPEVVLGVVTDDDIERINESQPQLANAQEVKPLFDAPVASSPAAPEPAAEKAPKMPRKAAAKPEAEKSAPVVEPPAPETEPAAPIVEPESPEAALTPQQRIAALCDENDVSEGWFMSRVGRRGDKFTDLTDKQAEEAIANFAEITKED